MIRVHVICEGQTEETFVNEVLAETLRAKNIYLYPALVGEPGHKGGHFNLMRVMGDVRVRLLSDATAYCTTFFDYYGLPGDFPGKRESAALEELKQKADSVQQSLCASLADMLGEDAMRRFIPYVQMHEFEGLLFSDTDGLASGINRVDLAHYFSGVREEFDSPEAINDNPVTAPSKRILNRVGGYQKPLHGVLAALEIGLNQIRKECALFNGWITDLEGLQPLS